MLLMKSTEKDYLMLAVDLRYLLSIASSVIILPWKPIIERVIILKNELLSEEQFLFLEYFIPEFLLHLLKPLMLIV